MTNEQQAIANETVAKVALSTFIELRKDPVLAAHFAANPRKPDASEMAPQESQAV